MLKSRAPLNPGRSAAGSGFTLPSSAQLSGAPARNARQLGVAAERAEMELVDLQVILCSAPCIATVMGSSRG
jgi:hypothetical protein